MDKIESLKNKEAFEYYYSLGDKRSCSKVAERFHVSERTVYNWSSWYNWRDRVMHRDIKNAKKLEEKTDTTLIEAKLEYLAIINDIIEIFKAKLHNGDIKVNSVNDLDRLAKLEMLLREENLPSDDKIINIIIEKDQTILEHQKK